MTAAGSKPKCRQRAGRAAPSALDQRGADKIPLSVKIVPGERTKEDAEKEERERREHDEKAAVDKRLADQTQRLADETENLAIYSRWLAGFTLLLFFAAIVQIGLFVWQLRMIRKSLDDAKIAANAAKDGAIAARDSADTAKTSMIAGNRAYAGVETMDLECPGLNKVSYEIPDIDKLPAWIAFVFQEFVKVTAKRQPSMSQPR